MTENICRENKKAHLIFKNLFSENLAVFMIMWKNMIAAHRTQMTI